MSKLFPSLFFVPTESVKIKCGLCGEVQAEGFVLAVRLPSSPATSVALADPKPVECAICHRAIAINPRLFASAAAAEAEIAGILLRFAENENCEEMRFVADRY